MRYRLRRHSVMAKSREPGVLEPSSAFEGSHSSDIGFSSQSYRQQSHQLYYQHDRRQLPGPSNVFLHSDDTSSFAFVLSDVPRSETSESLNQLRTHPDQSSSFRSSVYNERSNSYDACDNAHIHLSSRNAGNFETESYTAAKSTASTTDHRRSNYTKSGTMDSSLSLIDFGTPPTSPFKSPAATQHKTFQYSPEGKDPCMNHLSIIVWHL